MAIQASDVAAPPPRRRRGAMAFLAAALVAGGSALLIASYFMLWRHWYQPGGNPWPLNDLSDPFVPIQTLFYGPGGSFQPLDALFLFGAPVVAALSALYALRGPRWRRLTLSLVSAAAGTLMLLVSLGYLILSAITDAAVLTVIDMGAYIGIFASLLTVVAAFGLVFSARGAGRRAPLTRVT